MNFDALIGDSFFFIYLFAAISVINYETFSEKQKIAIIYIFTYGISFNSQLDKKILLVCMIFTLFIYEEYLSISEIKKKDFFYRITYKGLDFLYLYMFRYKMLMICVAIGLRSYTFNRILLQILPDTMSANIVDSVGFATTILSAVTLCLGIHFMLTDFVQMHTFEEVFRIFAQYPYYGCPFWDSQKQEQLCQKMELIADIEDRTFFMRNKSYYFWSCENIKLLLKMNRKKISGNQHHNRSGEIEDFLHKWKYFFKYRYSVFKILKRLFRIVADNLRYVMGCLLVRCKKILKYLSRGHSTIEMQLIRILFYKRGLLLGSPIVKDEKGKIKIRNIVRRLYRMFDRKCLEAIYASIVFASLKHYLGINQITNFDYFRYYIVYLYIHVVQTNVNGKKYRPASKYFEEDDISEWSMEKIFVAGLGLCSRQITPKRIQTYDFLIKKYNLDIEEIKRLCFA